MANELPIEKKTLAVSMLAEGSSIRSIKRITGVHRDTVMRLGVRVGESCQRIMDEKCRNLNCARIEVDEVWGFIGLQGQPRGVNAHSGDFSRANRMGRRCRILRSNRPSKGQAMSRMELSGQRGNPIRHSP
jgi:hypothetical protein